MKTLLLLAGFLASMPLSAQKDKAYKCHWHEQGIEDLNSPTAELEYSEKGKFTYLVSNDNENIYVDLRIADRNVQRQLMFSGISLWINTDGKKHRKSGLRYPVMAERRRGSVPAGAGARDNRMVADSLILVGLSDEDELKIAANEKGNYTASLKVQDIQPTFIKFVLPLEKLKALRESDSDLSVLLGISYPEPVTGGMGPGAGAGGPPAGDMPAQGGGGGRSGGGRSGGGRSGGSMPRGSGMPSGGAYSSQPLVLVWLDPLELAQGKK